MKTTVITFALVAFLVAVTGCTSRKSVSVSSVTAQRAFSTKNFNKVEAHDILDVRVEVGKACAATVTAPDNLLEYVKVDVDGDALVARFDYPDGDVDFDGETPRIVVDVTMPRITAVSAQGMSSVKVRGASGGRLDVSTRGMSTLALVGDAAFDSFSVTSGGQSDFQAGNIRATSANITVTGQAFVALADLVTDNVIITAGGQATVEGKTLTTALSGVATASGQASISFGNQTGPVRITTTITGQSDINLGR